MKNLHILGYWEVVKREFEIFLSICTSSAIIRDKRIAIYFYGGKIKIREKNFCSSKLDFDERGGARPVELVCDAIGGD